MSNEKPAISGYEPFALFDEKEDVNCSHNQVETACHSFDGNHLWKCSNCGKKFRNKEIEALKEEHRKNQ